MPSRSLSQICDLVSDVAIKDAKDLMLKFTKLATPHSFKVDIEFLFKTFAFMNCTLAVGIWSNLSNIHLRRDLLVELKFLFPTKLALEISKMGSTNTLLLNEELNIYLNDYITYAQRIGCADSSTARLYAFERIQNELEIDDDIMNKMVPALWSGLKGSSGVESVAMQVNKEAQEQKPKGFLRRLFGM